MPAQASPAGISSGVLLVVSLLPFVVLSAVHGPSGTEGLTWQLSVACVSAGSLLLAALAIPRRAPNVGRVLVTAGALGMLAIATPALLRSPFLALTVLLVVTGSLAAVWYGEDTQARPRTRRLLLASRLRGASMAALASWILASLITEGGDPSTMELLAVSGSFLVVGVLAAQWAVLHRSRHPRRAVVLILALAASVITLACYWGAWWPSFSGGVALAAAAVIALPIARSRETERTGWWELLLGHPERLLVGTFAGLSVVGTLALALPQSSATGRSIGFLDASFTAVSAVCVTGLIVLDTPVDFSLLGQLVILLLIQLGGLGIMTFSTAALRLLGRRMSMRHEGAVASLISLQDRGRLAGAAQHILLVTFSAEAVGAVLLFTAFLGHGDAAAQAFWRAIFTSISGFCNAGFALQSTSLVPYQTDPLVLHVVGTLIVLGGLSPAAVLALPALSRRTRGMVSAQVKLSLVAAAFLLIAGFAFVLAFEWNNSLERLSILDRIHNAWFQSITLRTAGFNSIDIAAVRPATLALMMLWMFIGGSPGGTAGGIKTTTVAVLFLAVLGAVRRLWSVTVFGRRIPERTLYKAVVIATLGVSGLVLGTLAILLTQAMPARDAVFEVVSALGTVGLSVGGTNRLDGVGKAIVIVCMFVGRVGPLTVLMFLSARTVHLPIERPEEEIDVG